MGFMQIQSLDISEITMTETSTEPSPIIFEDDNKKVLDEQEERKKYRKYQKRDLLLPPPILTYIEKVNCRMQI